MKKTIKSHISSSVKIIFTATSLYFLLKLISIQKVVVAIENINVYFLCAAFLLTFIQLPLKVLKWTRLVRIHYSEFSFRDGMTTYLQGMALATISPFAIGELARGMFVKCHLKTELTAKTFLDKFFDFSTVTFLASNGLLIHLGFYQILPIAIIAYIMFLYFLKDIITTSIKIVPQKLSNHGIIQRLITGISMINRKSIFFNSCTSMLYFLLFYLQTYLLLLSLDMEASLYAIFLFPIVTLSTIIPLTISGLGIREWTAVIMLKQAEVSASVAFNCFFLQFLLTNGLLSIIGGFCFLFIKVNPKNHTDASVD